MRSEKGKEGEPNKRPREFHGQAAFEKERDEILGQLSDTYKSMFGRIGFAKWSSMTLPVLILSPYDVPPRPVREQWFVHFQKFEQVGKLESLPYLVYWYGTLQMDEAYSFLSPKLVTPYENAVKKKAHVIPAAIVKKQNDPNKTLSDNDLNVIRGFEEMEQDLPLEPSDRKRGVIDFQEDYEMELSDNEETGRGAVDDAVSKPKKKQKVTKQHDNKKVDQDAEKPKKKNKDKKTNASSKSKAKQVLGDEFDFDDDVYEDDRDAAKPSKSLNKKIKDEKKTVSSKKKVNEVRDDEFDHDEDDESAKMDPVQEYEQAIAADKLPESDDEMDDNYDPPSDVEDKDPGHEDLSALKKAKAKAKQRKEEWNVIKVEKKKKQTKTKVLSEEELKQRELKAFRQCEERFCPLLERWHRLLVGSQDPDNLHRILNKILPVVNDFSAVYIEAYDISNLLKETKNALKAKNAKLDKCAEVKEAFRLSYSSKKPMIPIGLQIRKNVDITRSASLSPVKAEKRHEPEEPQTTVLVKEESGSITKPIAQKSSNATAPLKVASSDARSVSPKPAPKKKKFSLTNLMPKTRVDLEADAVHDRSSHGGSKKVLVLPAWMTEKQAPIALDDPRALALEFLLDMSAFFPPSKVNRESIAHAVEAALYKVAREDSDDWVPIYWERVHLLIAGICGKLQPTSLFDLIMNGRFESADQLVGLPKKTFIAAFDGDMVDV